MKKPDKPLVLWDGDIVVYRTLSACENETKWSDEPNEIWSLHTNLTQARDMFKATMQNMIDTLSPDQVVICLSDSDNFRKSILPTYKWNRKDTRKPMGFTEFREWVKEQDDGGFLRVIQYPSLEADDVMGILATKPENQGNAIIVSKDKDMKTVPAMLWRDSRLVHTTEAQADAWHAVQTLAGDATDGYAGCPGVGISRAEEAVKARTILVPYKHTIERGPRKGETETRYEEKPTKRLWDVVLSRFKAAGLTEADALVQARVSRILRWSDWDTEKKEVIQWTPPKV